MALVDLLAPGGNAARLTRGLHKAASLSIYAFLSEAQVASAQARDFALDMTAAIQAAMNSGLRILVPSGLYRHDGQLEIPATAEMTLVGTGFNTEFRAGSAMAIQMFKKTLAEGANRSPVNIENILFNANRLANICLAIGAGKAGRQRNIKCWNFLVGGFRGGNTNGDTTASFYENDIYQIIIDAGTDYADGSANMAQWGMWLLKGATDNLVTMVIPSYVSEVGIDNQGAGNVFLACHPYGDNDRDTGPKFGIRSDIFCQIVDFYADNMTQAGIRVNGEGVIIDGGLHYWATDNIPASGGAVPIEVATGLNVLTVSGGVVRNSGPNPYIRFLGTIPPRLTYIGMTPASHQDDLRAAHRFERSLGVRAGGGTEAAFDVCTSAAGQKALVRYGVNDKTRYEMGTEGNTTAGTDAMDSFLLRALGDDLTTWTNVLRYYRGAKQLELYNKIVLSNLTRIALQASNAPSSNNDMTFSLASDTSLRIQVKGSDGTTRSALIALS